jgi:hypothetical protein
MNKKILLILLALVLLGIGFFFSYETFNKPVVIKEIKDSPFSILLKNEKETFIENTEWYEAKVEYPARNQKVRDQVLKMWTDFATETEVKKYTNLAEAKEGLQINVDGLKYAFVGEYTIATSSNTISYIYQIYNFTGGAHGGTSMVAITENESQEIIPVAQILPDSSLVKVAKLAEADLKKQKQERLKSYGNMTDKEITEAQKNDIFLAEGVKPTRDNYSVAWYDGDDIVISFGQYQVASYAEGMFEVRIPKTALTQ